MHDEHSRLRMPRACAWAVNERLCSLEKVAASRQQHVPVQVSVHVHAAHEAGRLSRLISLLHPKSGQVVRARPRALAKGATALVEVSLSRPLCLEAYGDFRALGRIALRDAGRTLAVGVVTALLEEA